MNRRYFLKLGLGGGVAALVWAAAPWPGVGPRVARRGRASTCPPLEERSLRLIAVGDIMAHLPVTESARQADGSYDFRPHFQYVRPIFKNADLVMGNLETPMAGGSFSGYPAFNGPDELAAGLKWAGFKALSLANNHSLDKGWKGLYRTAEVVKSQGLMYTGAFLAQEDRESPRLFSAGWVTVGLLAYTYGVNGPWKYPAGESWRLNFVDRELILNDLKELQKAGPDFTLVNIHFGDEYHRKPNKGQMELVEALFRAGVDLVIGHHPHVVQPGVMRVGPEGAQAAVFSLGNFISNQKDRYTDQGLMVSAQLGLDFKGRKVLGPLTLHQTRCLRRVVEGRPTYRVLPVREAVDNPAAYGLNADEAAFLGRDQLAMSRHLVDY